MGSRLKVLTHAILQPRIVHQELELASKQVGGPKPDVGTARSLTIFQV
jgi:hypothetical protein